MTYILYKFIRVSHTNWNLYCWLPNTLKYTRAAHHVLITCYTLHLRKQPLRAARVSCLVAMVNCYERTRNLNPPTSFSKIHVFLQKRQFLTFHYCLFTKDVNGKDTNSTKYTIFYQEVRESGGMTINVESLMAALLIVTLMGRTRVVVMSGMESVVTQLITVLVRTA